MTFSLKHGAALAEIGDATLPSVSASRGLQVGRTGVAASAGVLAATLDANRVALDEALQLEETTGAGTRIWTGSVFEIDQTVDRQLNQLRYAIRAQGPLRRLVAAGDGYSTMLQTEIMVDAAIGLVLDQVGIPAADRDIGASTRVLGAWWLDARDDAWAAVQTLVRTAGPRARLYEDAQGRIAFRDQPLPTTPVRTLRGRNSGLAAGAIISRLERDTPGRNRVVNEVELPYREPTAAVTRVVASDRRTYDSSDTSSLAQRYTRSDLAALGAEDGDLIIIQALASRSAAITASAEQQVTMGGSPGQSWFVTARLGLPTTALGPGIRPSELTGSADYGVLHAWVIRNAQLPSAATSARNRFAGLNLGLTVTMQAPAAYAANSLVLSTAFGGAVSGSPSAPPTGWTAGAGTGMAWRVATEQTFQAGDWVFPGPAQGIASVAVLVVPLTIATLWQGLERVTLDNGQSYTTDLTLNGPAESINAPVAGEDYTGSATITVTLVSPTVARVTFTATADGTIDLTRLRGQGLGLAPEEIAPAADAGSVAAYGRRSSRPRVHPYLSAAEAQDLADEIVDYWAHPRASWQVLLDGDRDADTMAACLESEIGEPVQTNIDAAFNHLGEVLAIDHRISGPATLLETRLTMLAAEAMLPAAMRLYLDNTNNPLFLDALANPLELR